MKAWGVMRERAYAFDLVLTEVTMPTLSGIELLSRIVASDECKNIPVIMMSSQDSIGTVLRCMQKGAVDFLVKPVRKNELRNLWQHVWRRHAVSSSLCSSFKTSFFSQSFDPCGNIIFLGCIVWFILVNLNLDSFFYSNCIAVP